MEFKEELKKPDEEQKTDAFKQLLNSPQAKEFIKKWKKKQFEEAGIVELLLLCWEVEGDQTRLLKRAGEVLSKLNPTEFLSKLAEFKIAPEKIFNNK